MSDKINVEEVVNKKIPKVRDRYSEDVVVVLNTGEGLTQQEFRDETDINLILQKYGVYAIAGEHPPEVYRDVSKDYDYMEAFQAVQEAQEAFASLPAHARRALGDDPVKLMQLSQTEDGVKQLVKLGFADPNKYQAGSVEQPEPAAAPSETQEKGQ